MRQTRSGRANLASDATRLKKAYLLATAWVGRRPGNDELTFPDYPSWEKNRLRRQVDDLRHDVGQFMPSILMSGTRRDLPHGLTSWMADRFDEWAAAGGGVMSLGTAHEFERQFGELAFRQFGEVPPYTELLLQGWFGLAFRHPEYMLARDLQLAYSLYYQAEYLLIKADGPNPPAWARKGSESYQALARNVIQCCFNLLEAFVSGLARAAAMEGSLDDSLRHKLLDNAGPLRRRVILVARTLSGGHLELDARNSDFSVLFDQIKPRRDAFVHCEPGPQRDARGAVKEQLFHEVSKDLVDDAVARTESLIRQIWKATMSIAGPRWLPVLSGQPSAHGFKLSRADADV
jgi:hypothetical protein